MPVFLSRYLIGREAESVNESDVYKCRLSTHKVTRLLVDQLDVPIVTHPKMRESAEYHIEIATDFSSTLLNRSETAEHLAKKRQLWIYSAQKNPEVFQAIRYTMLLRLTTFFLVPDRKLSNVVYQITKCLWGFLI